MKVEEYLGTKKADDLNIPDEYKNKNLTPKLKEKIVKHANENDVQPEALASIAFRESSWDPSEVNGTSYGLVQINLGNLDGKRMHKDVSKEEALDQDFALNWAAKNLKKHSKDSDLKTAFAKHKKPYAPEAAEQYGKAALESYNKMTTDLPDSREERIKLIYKKHPHLKPNK